MMMIVVPTLVAQLTDTIDYLWITMDKVLGVRINEVAVIAYKGN
jgi:hypothetical protein